MSEGNGIDLGSIYGLLREVAAVVNSHSQRFDALADRVARIEANIVTKADLAATEHALRADLATKADLAGLRQTVIDYHHAVVGHGILISEHDERLGRIERHLGFSE